MTKSLKTATLLAGCFALAEISLLAQPTAPMATQQLQNYQNLMRQPPWLSSEQTTNAPEVFPGENADVGPQRILRLMPRHTHFLVKADSQYLYSDNVLLQPNPTVPGTEFINTIEAAVEPTPYKLGPGRFTPAVGFLSQWFNYEMGNHDLSAVDFNVQTVFVSGRYQLPGNWMVFGELDYSRFLSQATYDEFYDEYVPSVGVQRLFQVSDRGVLAVEFQTAYHASWTANPPHDSQDRMDDDLSLSFAWRVSRHLVVQPYDRFEYSYYRFDTAHNPGRNDVLNSVGLSAAWYFTPSLAFRVFASNNLRLTSDSLAQNYVEHDVGANLTWSFRF